MKELNFSVGKKVYTLLCDPSESDGILSLANELNYIVNNSALQNRKLSDENLLVITAMNLLERVKKCQNPEENQMQIHKELSNIKEKIQKINSFLQNQSLSSTSC